MILEYKGDRVNVETLAVAINLMTNIDFVNTIAETGGLRYLFKKAIKSKDPLLFKMLRNVSQHPDVSIKLKFLVLIFDNELTRNRTLLTI